MRYALGLIETVGLAAAIQASDAAVKTADVKLVGIENSRGAGRQTIFLVGDVSSVTVAVEAGMDAAEQAGAVFAGKVIASPSRSLKEYLSSLNISENNSSLAERKESADCGRETAEKAKAGRQNAKVNIKKSNVKQSKKTKEEQK